MKIKNDNCRCLAAVAQHIANWGPTLKRNSGIEPI